MTKRFNVGDRVVLDRNEKATGTITGFYAGFYTVQWDTPEIQLTYGSTGWGESLLPLVDGPWGRSVEENSPREELLKDAIETVTKQRNNEYGPPTQDFERIALLMTGLGFTFEEGPIDSHHVAMMMICLKLSRLTWDPTKEDNWLDIAGYAGCGWECALSETGG